MQRFGTTRKGHKVELDKLTPVDGGWDGWVLNSDGYAVSVFVPGRSA